MGDIYKEMIKKEFDDFFEFPSSDKGFVTSVSCRLFAEHILKIANYKDAERYRWLKTRKKLSITADTPATKWTREDGSTFLSAYTLCEGETQHAPAESLDEMIDEAMRISK